jgi:hypothetical protein
MKTSSRWRTTCLSWTEMVSKLSTLRSLEHQPPQRLLPELKPKHSTLRTKTDVSIGFKRCRTKRLTIAASLQRCLNSPITRDSLWLLHQRIFKSEVVDRVVGVKWMNAVAPHLATVGLDLQTDLQYQTGSWSLQCICRAQSSATTHWWHLQHSTAVWCTPPHVASVCAASRLCCETN